MSSSLAFFHGADKLTSYFDSRSFARIHRTNLTKQGVLPLTFLNEADYSLVSAGDIISTKGLDALLRGDLSAEVKVVVEKKDGSIIEIATDHALSKDQVSFFFYCQ